MGLELVRAPVLDVGGDGGPARVAADLAGVGPAVLLDALDEARVLLGAEGLGRCWGRGGGYFFSAVFDLRSSSWAEGLL